jgi:formylglycine-generating enzyme required for sulfatase activity
MIQSRPDRFCLMPVLASVLVACSTLQPLPAAGEVMVSKEDGARLHYVPAGAFTMGNDAGWAAQKPAHEVSLGAFWIDETEVTNRMYALCVQAGACLQPQNVSSYNREGYYLDTQYAEYPVVYVSWQDANTYCAWAGRVLPSEAQWEKAARGSDGRLYPWGGQAPSEDLLNNFDVSFLEDTVQVGSYPQGASPYGALDMAGNAWEWTADWFDAYPGGDPAASEGYGHTYRVLRGGSYVDAADATTRYGNSPELRNYDIGFRCVLSAAGSD